MLDNCEHLIDASASLIERLLCECPGLSILTTSREPLRPVASCPACQIRWSNSIRYCSRWPNHKENCGDPIAVYQVLWAQAEVARNQGELSRADELLNESLRLALEHGDTAGSGYLLSSLALVALARGDHASAAARMRQSAQARRTNGDHLGVSHCLEALGSIRIAAGDLAGGARLLASAAAARRVSGGGPFPPWTETYERALAAAKAGLGDAAFAGAWTEGSSSSAADALAHADRAPAGS